MALRCEIKPYEFWDSTVQEVNDLIEARANKQQAEMKFKALCGYNESMMIIQGINNMFAKSPKQPQQLWEIYPTLFDEPVEQIKQQKEDVMKARLIAYSEAWKKKHGKE